MAERLDFNALAQDRAVSQAKVIARGLKALFRKRLNLDLSGLERLTDLGVLSLAS